MDLHAGRSRSEGIAVHQILEFDIVLHNLRILFLTFDSLCNYERTWNALSLLYFFCSCHQIQFQHQAIWKRKHNLVIYTVESHYDQWLLRQKPLTSLSDKTNHLFVVETDAGNLTEIAVPNFDDFLQSSSHQHKIAYASIVLHGYYGFLVCLFLDHYESGGCKHLQIAIVIP